VIMLVAALITGFDEDYSGQHQAVWRGYRVISSGSGLSRGNIPLEERQRNH